MSRNTTFLKPKSWLSYAALALSLACFVGCPDYSHLRPEPDYSNMTDSGGESEQPEAEAGKR